MKAAIFFFALAAAQMVVPRNGGDNLSAAACAEIKCGEPLKCPPPTKVQYGDNQVGTQMCCGACWAEDHILPIDRKTEGPTMFKVDQSPDAPATCKGVQCFQPVCAEGQKVGNVAGQCCPSCI